MNDSGPRTHGYQVFDSEGFHIGTLHLRYLPYSSQSHDALAQFLHEYVEDSSEDFTILDDRSDDPSGWVLWKATYTPPGTQPGRVEVK